MVVLKKEKLLAFKIGRRSLDKRLRFAMSRCPDFYQLEEDYPAEFQYYCENVYDGHCFMRWYDQYKASCGSNASFNWYMFIYKFLGYFSRATRSKQK